MFRFIHAADIHLDSPLRGLTRSRDSHDEAVQRIRSATRVAFEDLVRHTIEEDARFLVIAGDLYDGDWKDYRTGLFFFKQMARLRDKGIPVFLIYGNHDAASQITKHLSIPDNVKVFSARRPESHLVEELGVALHGQSFANRAVKENLAVEYPDPVPAMLNIGILHTGLAGEDGHEPYAPCSLSDLVTKGYDYWALGHIHQPSVRNEHPFVVYSGNLQGRHIREEGPRGAVSVSVEDGAIVGIEWFHVDTVRWCLVDVSAEGCTSLAEVHGRVRAGIERQVGESDDDRLLACRIQISGATPIQGTIEGARDELLAEAQTTAMDLGEEILWIEKVAIATTPDHQVLDPSLADALGDLEAACSDETLQAELEQDLRGLVSKLPSEVKKSVEDEFLRAALEGNYRRLIELAAPNAMAQLTGTEG